MNLSPVTLVLFELCKPARRAQPGVHGAHLFVFISERGTDVAWTPTHRSVQAASAELLLQAPRLRTTRFQILDHGHGPPGLIVWASVESTCVSYRIMRNVCRYCIRSYCFPYHASPSQSPTPLDQTSQTTRREPDLGDAIDDTDRVLVFGEIPRAGVRGEDRGTSRVDGRETARADFEWGEMVVGDLVGVARVPVSLGEHGAGLGDDLCVCGIGVDESTGRRPLRWRGFRPWKRRSWPIGGRAGRGKRRACSG